MRFAGALLGAVALAACTRMTSGTGALVAPAPDGGDARTGGASDVDAQWPGRAGDAAAPGGHAHVEPLRFVVLGDGGTGDEYQRRVAAAVKKVCDARGCEFALYLGDNIYESGVTAVDDEQFVTKFEEPYADLDLPFYVVLGNHDYTHGLVAGAGFDSEKADYQIEYTARSDKWNMPAHYYSFRVGEVAFFALDTNAIVHDESFPAAEQAAWLDAEIAASDAPWKIAFGHHPYVSNGYHGNAGNYDGLGFLPSVFDAQGDTMAAFSEQSLCGHVQLYFSGHDHDREWLEPTCGTTFVVSGAAAKLRPLSNRDEQPSRFKDDQKRGFLWVEVDGASLTGVFYDDAGTIDYVDVVTLPALHVGARPMSP